MGGGGLLSYDTLVLAASGAAGSCSASLLTMPLTTAFTRLQLEERLKSGGPIATMLFLARTEGLSTLYRGCQSTVTAVSISNFVYFYSFHGLKRLTGSSGQQSALRDLLFACCAGCINVLLTNPLWVVNQRLKMAGLDPLAPRYRGLLDGLGKIWVQEGIAALWNGTKASLMLVSNPAIKFTMYELLKRRYTSLTQKAIGGVAAFWLGAAATAVATLLTYPLQIVQARARHGKNVQTQQQEKVVNMVITIIRESGVRGLFRGVDSKLLQSVLAAGFMFLAYEKIAALVFAILGARRKA